MANTRTIASVTALAIGTALVLAGCVAQTSEAPTPTASTSAATPTSTPSATGYTPKSTPGSAQPPTSSEDAYLAATQVAEDFTAVQYEIQADGGANPERIEPYATGSALNKVISVASQLAAKGGTVEGAPVWTSDASATTFGVLTYGAGDPVENGYVYLRGCFDVTNQTATNADGTPAEVSEQRKYPVQLNVMYLPNEKSWKVDDGFAIAGQEGAPAC